MKNADVAKAYRRLFNTPDGQTVLRDLMKSNLLRPTAITDPVALQIYEGKRSIVTGILILAHGPTKALDKIIKQTSEPEQNL